MAPEDNDQVVEPGVPSNEDMEQWLNSLADDQPIDLPALMVGQPFPINAEEGDEDEEDKPSTDDDTEEEGPEGEEAGDDDTITVNGNKFAREDIERLYAFDQHLRQHPDVAERVNAALAPAAPTGQPVVSETKTPPSTEFVPPTVPENIDLDDPAIKFLWDQHVSTQKQLFDRDQREQQIIAQQQTFQQTQIQRQAVDDMNIALGQFKEKFSVLNEDDIAQIRNEAGPLVETYMKNLPPVQALYRSMEVAAYANADMRKKLEQPETPNPSSHRRNQSRKRKLGEISGTPRSAPRTNESRPVYRSDRDMVNEFAQALAEEGLGR